MHDVVYVCVLICMSDMELKEKIDYVSLLFRQIDRCNSSKEGFAEDVGHLRVLCVPFEDQEFLDRLDLIEKDYSRKLEEINSNIGSLEELYVDFVYAKNRFVSDRLYKKMQFVEAKYRDLAQFRALGIFRACIELLNRKGLIIERLRVGKE
jgi:hypothetical protein